MDQLLEIMTRHSQHAHWYVFGAIILAGFNIPISADLMVLLAAFLAAVIIPEHTSYLYLAVLFGCAISAACAYWLGRLLGPQLGKFKLFKTHLSPQRLLKIRRFYESYGIWTLIIGRFIPFGVRNCLFMSSGISKLPFSRFLWMDAIACFIWSTLTFSLFYTMGQHYSMVWHYVKTFNILIFIAFGVTVIATLWYKFRKKARSPGDTP